MCMWNFLLKTWTPALASHTPQAFILMEWLKLLETWPLLLPPTPHKHLYLWSDHRTLKNILAFHYYKKKIKKYFDIYIKCHDLCHDIKNYLVAYLFIIIICLDDYCCIYLYRNWKLFDSSLTRANQAWD